MGGALKEENAVDESELSLIKILAPVWKSSRRDREVEGDGDWDDDEP